MHRIVEFAGLVFPFIFFLNLHQFESLLPLNPCEVVCPRFYLICFVLLYILRMDAKFYHENFSHNRKTAHLHWTLYCKVCIHQRVFLLNK